jgi:hypothetical protein
MVLLHRAVFPNTITRGSFVRRANYLFAALACLLVLLCPAPASAQAVVQHDFEDGTLQGWTPRGVVVVLTNTTEAAATGARSLKTTGHTAGFHGPSLSLPGTLPGRDVGYVSSKLKSEVARHDS